MGQAEEKGLHRGKQESQRSQERKKGIWKWGSSLLSSMERTSARGERHFLKRPNEGGSQAYLS